jgi:hypothetical protein
MSWQARKTDGNEPKGCHDKTKQSVQEEVRQANFFLLRH